MAGGSALRPLWRLRAAVLRVGGGNPRAGDRGSGRHVGPGRRESTFRVPSWVDLPVFLQPELAARNDVKIDGLPYRIDRALHFSNGGGVYVGQDLRTDDQVVLKEARPHAGLDIDGTDAVSRLLRERDILERLKGLDVVPGVRDHLMLGEHHFLVLDFIDGTALRSEMARR